MTENPTENRRSESVKEIPLRGRNILYVCPITRGPSLIVLPWMYDRIMALRKETPVDGVGNIAKKLQKEWPVDPKLIEAAITAALKDARPSTREMKKSTTKHGPVYQRISAGDKGKVDTYLPLSLLQELQVWRDDNHAAPARVIEKIMADYGIRLAPNASIDRDMDALRPPGWQPREGIIAHPAKKGAGLSQPIYFLYAAGQRPVLLWTEEMTNAVKEHSQKNPEEIAEILTEKWGLAIFPDYLERPLKHGANLLEICKVDTQKDGPLYAIKIRHTKQRSNPPFEPVMAAALRDRIKAIRQERPQATHEEIGLQLETLWKTKPAGISITPAFVREGLGEPQTIYVPPMTEDEIRAGLRLRPTSPGFTNAALEIIGRKEKDAELYTRITTAFPDLDPLWSAPDPAEFLLSVRTARQNRMISARFVVDGPVSGRVRAATP